MTNPPEYNKTTPCECPMAGFCERHQVNKSKHLHKLCQTKPSYFQMWEDCKGPLQFCTEEEKRQTIVNKVEEQEKKEYDKEMREKISLPSPQRQAMNFASAMTKHVLSGFKRVTDEEKNRRLEICKGCPFFISHSNRCEKCGCFLLAKAGWTTQHCPIDKW